MLEKSQTIQKNTPAPKAPKFPGLKKLALKDKELCDFLLLCKDEDLRKKALTLLSSRIESIH